MRSPAILMAAALLSSGCASAKPHAPSGNRAPPTRRAARPARSEPRDADATRDPELERRVARLELRLMERDAQVEDLQARLEDARAEVVRAMAKLRTVTSRAEAASGMAEAEVALQSLRSGSGGTQPPEVSQAATLLRQSGTEFDRQNYGGALYLANQAKAVAAMGRGRLTDGNRGGGSGAAAPRPGETAFALPLHLKASGRGNVREGPGTGFAVAFAVDAGTPLTGLSYTDDWVRVSDDASGRGGWISRMLVGRP